MIVYEFGDILLMPFPFTDQTTTKKRPTVVISSQKYNLSRPDLIVMAISSQLTTPLLFGEMSITDWQLAGLLKTSVIKPVVTTIQKDLVVRKLGQLNQQDRNALKKHLRSLLDE